LAPARFSGGLRPQVPGAGVPPLVPGTAMCARADSALDRCPGEVGPLEKRTGQDGAPQARASQRRAAEVGARQVRAGQGVRRRASRRAARHRQPRRPATACRAESPRPLLGADRAAARAEHNRLRPRPIRRSQALESHVMHGLPSQRSPTSDANNKPLATTSPGTARTRSRAPRDPRRGRPAAAANARPAPRPRPAPGHHPRPADLRDAVARAAARPPNGPQARVRLHSTRAAEGEIQVIPSR
jgi:hypothetical protein